MPEEVEWATFPAHSETSLRKGFERLTRGTSNRKDAISTNCSRLDNDVKTRTLDGMGQSSEDSSRRIYFAFGEVSTKTTSASEHEILEILRRRLHAELDVR